VSRYHIDRCTFTATTNHFTFTAYRMYIFRFVNRHSQLSGVKGPGNVERQHSLVQDCFLGFSFDTIT